MVEDKVGGALLALVGGAITTLARRFFGEDLDKLSAV